MPQRTDPEPEWDGLEVIEVPNVPMTARPDDPPPWDPNGESDPDVDDALASTMAQAVHLLQALNVKAERIAVALERAPSVQGAHSASQTGISGGQTWNVPKPPQQGQQQQQQSGEQPPTPNWICPDHGEPPKWVPPGLSQRTGKTYNGFWACPERGCRQRPR